jgi:predicted TIM-barrel fold metal-dependent hydrolase
MSDTAIDRIMAIDVHVHAHAAGDAAGNGAAEAAKRYFGSSEVPVALDGVAAYYRARNMVCVVFTVDETLSGRSVVSNDDVLDAAARNAEVLIPFVSVDPTRGPQAVAELERLIARGGVRGFKLHPPLQAFFPNDRSTGVRGGGGIRLKYGAPMLLDDVAVDFPDMPIVMAHPSFPWQDEALSVCLHKPNVFIDLSGWSPKYFPPNLIQYANTLLREKVLFGSDYPLITPDRWLADFAALPIRDEVRPLILKANAAALLGLS